MIDKRAALVHGVVTNIQVAAGAAPYATPEELIDIFSSVADSVPEAPTQVDRMMLRRLLASTTAHVGRHAGAILPLRPIVTFVADADDPREAFKEALSSLRRRS